MAVPQSRFTQSGMRDRVTGDLGLRSSNLLTTADLNAWAIEASDIISRETRWYKVTVTANSTASTKEYDLPTGCLAVEEVNYSTSGTAGTHLPLDLVTLNDLYMMDPFWRSSSTGTPLWYYLRGNTSYGLHYTPGTSVTGGIQIVYTALAPVPAADGDTYSVPNGSGECILAYVLWRGALKDATGEGGRRVELYQRRWEQSLNDLKRQVESVSEGEACVMGADSDGLGLDRWWNFNPNATIPAP